MTSNNMDLASTIIDHGSRLHKDSATYVPSNANISTPISGVADEFAKVQHACLIRRNNFLGVPFAFTQMLVFTLFLLPL